MTCSEPNLKIEFLKVFSIESYSGFCRESQYSDKVVLPLSLCYSLVRAKIHFPPIFSIHLKSNYLLSELCGALEYTSESDTIYCPNHILQKLKLRSSMNSKAPVILEVLSHTKCKFPFPELRKVELYSNKNIEESVCRKGLMSYSVLKSGSSIMVNIK